MGSSHLGSDRMETVGSNSCKSYSTTLGRSNSDSDSPAYLHSHGYSDCPAYLHSHGYSDCPAKFSGSTGGRRYARVLGPVK